MVEIKQSITRHFTGIAVVGYVTVSSGCVTFNRNRL